MMFDLERLAMWFLHRRFSPIVKNGVEGYAATYERNGVHLRCEVMAANPHGSTVT